MRGLLQQRFMRDGKQLLTLQEGPARVLVHDLVLGTWSVAAGASAAAAPATGAKPFRPSIDSHTSCTPEAMVMTPGMMAVLQKYAGSGASTDVSAAGMDSGSAPSQPHLLHGTGAQGKAAQPQPSAGMPNKSAAGHTSSIPRPAIVNIHAFAMAPEDDTCALYHELIRSKDVNCSSLADGSAGSKAGMAQGRGQAAKPAQVSGAAAGIPKLAVNVPAEQQRSGRTSATPLSIRREDWGEHNKVCILTNSYLHTCI